MKNRLLKLKEVCTDTGLSRTHIYRLMAEGEFPKQICLTKRAVAWDERAVQAWINERLSSSGKTKEGIR